METEYDDLTRCQRELSKMIDMFKLPEITQQIRKETAQRALMRRYFTVEELSPGREASYPLWDDFDEPVWMLPGMGYIAQDYMELASEEVVINTFTVQAAKDWLLKYERRGRKDQLQRAIESVAMALSDYETEAFWRLIMPPATSGFDGAGILPPREANIFQMPSKDPASGYFSKELVNRMIVGACRMGKQLKEILLSPEDLADIREWTDTDVDPATRAQIFQASGLGNLWGIKLTECEDLGVRGKYNINDSISEWGPFKGDSKKNAFNDYYIAHGNVVDQNGNLLIPGETQIIGLCDDPTDYLVMPVRQHYTAYYDPSFIRRQKTGFFGMQEFGMACLKGRSIIMGIIDRYTPTEPEIKGRQLVIPSQRAYLDHLVMLLSE